MTVFEPKKELSVLDHADVAVCGGGPAGIIAAAAAARNGARTILIEKYGFLGGMATLSMVSPLSVFNKNSRRIIGGIPLEFIEAMEKLGGAITGYPSGNIHFDPEVYKLAAQQMILKSNVIPYYHTLTAGCIADEGKPSYLIVESKSGRQAVRADYIIDCTGDGDIAARAGFAFELGDADGELQPMTLWFRLGGVDTEHLEGMHMKQENTKYSNQKIRAVFDELKLTRQVPKFGGPWCTTTMRDGEATINMTRFAGNGTNVKSLTEGECVLREDVFKFVELLKNNIPEFEHCFLIDTGTQAGLRETRRIKGMYRMTAEDILEARHFPDSVAKGAHPIDIHRAEDTRQDVQFISEPYSIPYRCMIPENSQNLLVCGRCVSASREAFASIRVQATCMALGQGAGTAAALCSRQGIPVAELDSELLQNRLRAQGAII